MPVKSEPRPAGRKVILGIFLSFSLKAHNYHIGPDFSNRKRFIIHCIICCAKEARALIVVDIE